MNEIPTRAHQPRATGSASVGSSATREHRRDRYRGALVGVAVGDALGAAFEGHAGPVRRTQVAEHLESLLPTRFTDDTAMTIAVAESLLDVDGLDPDHLAGTFVAHHSREPHRGYGAGTASLLRSIAGGADWRTAAPSQFRGTGSFGNGAAMRAAPYGLWADDPDRAAALARRGAAVSHSHPLAADAAAVQAAAVAHALSWSGAPGAHVHELLDALRSTATTDELASRLDLAGTLFDADVATVAARVGTSVAAVDAVPAAVCAFVHHPGSLDRAVAFAIELGGDTDTIASMTAAIGGAALGEAAIPVTWWQRTEGAATMRELADRIFVRRRR